MFLLLVSFYKSEGSVSHAAKHSTWCMLLTKRTGQDGVHLQLHEGSRGRRVTLSYTVDCRPAWATQHGCCLQKEKKKKTFKVAQQIKALTPKPDVLSSLPGNHIMENQLLIVLTSTCYCDGIHSHTGWVGGWKDGWMDGWKNGWVGVWKERWMVD